MPIIGGIEAGFVGASPSTLVDQKDAQMFDQIVKETQEKFFTTDPNSQDSLEQDLNNNPDKKQKYLDALKALEENPNSENREKFNQEVFNLNNVLLGEMLVGNQIYFNLVVDEINS